MGDRDAVPRVVSGRPIRMLLFAPIRGLDPAGGDVAYTEALLADPPVGVDYCTYPDALAQGLVRVRGRRPRHGRFGLVDFGLLGLRAVEVTLRKRGLLFREPYWYITVKPGAFDVIHSHLFALRQIGSAVPVVSSAGYPLEVLYENVDGWSPRRARRTTRSEELLARLSHSHVPGLWAPDNDLMTVYTERFRRWLVDRGRAPEAVEVVANPLQPLSETPRFSDGRTVLFVGRNFRSKGGDVAIAAHELLRADDEESKLLLVTSSIPADVDTSGSPSVEVHLKVPRETLLDEIYPRSDVMVLPTGSDCGAPYGLLEALQSGVVATVSDGDWLDERLIAPAVLRVRADPKEIADGVRRLLRQPADERVRSARRLWAENFSTEVIGAQLLAQYRRLAGAPGSPSHRPKVLVAARPMDLSGPVENAFVRRHLTMVHDLAQIANVSIVGLRAWHDTGRIDAGFADLPYYEVSIPKATGTRTDRIRASLRGIVRKADLAPWENELREIWIQTRAEVSVYIGPWDVENFRVLADTGPSVLVYEEDLRRMADLEPQSRRARVLRAFEVAADFRAGFRPSVVGVISQPEIQSAKRRFPTSKIVEWPFALPTEEWPVATTPSGGDHVLAVGNFAEERNADGLVEFLLAHQQRWRGTPPPVKIVSASGVTDTLAAHLEPGMVDLLPPVDDLRAQYDQARVAIVPAVRATGFKTTILQAWISGCPVVCSEVAVQTLKPRARRAVLSAVDADGLAEQVSVIWDDAERRAELAERGIEIARRDHDDERGRARFVTLVEQISRAAR